MPLYDDTHSLPESTSDTTANIIGWIDEDGHKHRGDPALYASRVDGVIVEYGKKSNPDFSQIRSVFKMDRHPTPEHWRQLIQIAAIRYGLLLQYEIDPELDDELQAEYDRDDNDDSDEMPF